MHKTVLYLESLNTDNLDKTILIYPVNQILQKYHYFLTYGSNSWITLSNRNTENNLVENAEKNKGIQTNKWNKSYKYNFSWVRIKIETHTNYPNKKMLYPEKKNHVEFSVDSIYSTKSNEVDKFFTML